MKLELHNYQRELVDYIDKNQNVGLFLEPGLGKTIITLYYIKKQLEKNPNFRAVVIAPLRVIYSTWPNEIEQWDCFKSLTYEIFHTIKKDAPLPLHKNIILVNPDGIHKIYYRLKRDSYWDLLVVDESTMFKTPSSKRFKLLKPMLQHFKQKMILTGTPIPNGYLNLWSQIYILDKGKTLEPFYTRYKKMYFYPSGYNGYVWELKDGYAELIQGKIKDFCISMKASKLIDMPSRVDRVQYNLLTRPLKEQYKILKNDFILELDKDTLVAPNVLVKLIKCQQFSNGIVYLENKSIIEVHNEKIKYLIELLDNLGEEPVIIFYMFNSDLQLLKKHLKTKSLTLLNGSTKPKQTQEIICQWNHKKIPILLAHPQAMSHGLNLQHGGHHAIWFGLTYNLEIYQQANARIYRQNQENNVVIHHLLTKGTIDEQIYTILTRKGVMQHSFMEQLKRQVLL